MSSNIAMLPIGNSTPLANLEAELCLIGALLYDNKISRDLAHLAPEHFYDPLHTQIWGAAMALIGEGGAADPVTVADALGQRDLIPMLGNLLADAYTGAAKSHAEIVVNAARLRQAIEYADVIRTAAMGGADAFDLISHAERNFARMVQESAPPSTNLIDARSSAYVTLDEIDREAEQGRDKGYMTGLRCFDRRMRGFRPGWLVVVAGRPSMGKAQPLDAKVLLRDGEWRKMGDLRLGDYLASVDGAPSRVSGVFPQGRRQLYRVTLSDGRSTEACAEHLWRVNCRYWPEARIISTAELIALLGSRRYQGRMWIDPASGHFGHSDALPLDPWVLGALLGDAKLTESTPIFSTADAEMLAELSARLGSSYEIKHAANYDYRLVTAGGNRRLGTKGVVPNGITEVLRSLGLHGTRAEEKFIPARYLSAHRQARVDLLRGLLDTDGWIETFGAVRFCTTSPQLAADVVALVRSLGGSASSNVRAPTYTYCGEQRDGRPAYVVNVANLSADDLFTVHAKRARRRPAIRTRRLNVVSVEPARMAEAQCISVSHVSSLYVTDDYIVTHNTALARAAAFGCAQRTKAQVVFFALEMARRELDERTLSQLSHIAGEGVAYKDMNGTSLQPGERARLRDLALRVPSNFIIDDSPILSVDYVRRRILSLKQRGPVAAVFIDYLQIMDRPDAKGRNEASVIGEMTKGLKQLAREAETCVVLLSQINRGVESRDDKRPQLSDLRESGAIEQDANAVLFPYREAYYLERSEPKDPKKQDDWRMSCAEMHRRMDVIAAKVRQGAVGTDHQTYFAEFDHVEDAPEDRR